MTNTTNIVTVALGFLGTAGSGITTFLVQAKKYEAKITDYVAKVEQETNLVLSQTQMILKKLENAFPSPVKPTVPAAKAKAPVKKTVEPKKRLR